MRCSSPRSNEIHQSAPWNVEPRVINSNGSIGGCIPGPAASRRAQRLGRKASASGLGCHHIGVCLHWNNCSPTYQEAGPSLPTKGEGAQHPLQLIFLQGVHRMKNKLHDGFLQTIKYKPFFFFCPFPWPKWVSIHLADALLNTSPYLTHDLDAHILPLPRAVPFPWKLLQFILQLQSARLCTQRFLLNQ